MEARVKRRSSIAFSLIVGVAVFSAISVALKLLTKTPTASDQAISISPGLVGVIIPTQRAVYAVVKSRLEFLLKNKFTSPRQLKPSAPAPPALPTPESVPFVEPATPPPDVDQLPEPSPIPLPRNYPSEPAYPTFKPPRGETPDPSICYPSCPPSSR